MLSSLYPQLQLLRQMQAIARHLGASFSSPLLVVELLITHNSLMTQEVVSFTPSIFIFKEG